MSPKRRTTLTLPVEALSEAERIARARKVNLSVVIAEVIEEGLRARSAAKAEGERRVQAFEAYCRAVSDLTEDEMLLLNGIIMEPADE
ncbi:MAG TPA: hypothetical protein VMQ86_10530 [Bryobacteraceae bacterium]|jgi:hypothetical protein|nr:hypothetical protein [Bryobacteraceae bacterium]